jgi:hypothetical protein
MSSDCCCGLARVRPFWRGRLLRLAACAFVLLVGSASTSVLVGTAMADDLPQSPAPSAQTDLDGTSTAPVASPETTTTTEVTSDAVETPAVTTDGSETSTDISATTSDTTGTASSSTDTSTDTSTTATEPTAGTTTDGTGAATDTAASSCTLERVAIADATGTADGTDAAGDTASTTVVEADTTDSTQMCVEEQASANTAEPDNAAVRNDAAPADAAASTPTARAEGDRGLQVHAGPVATSKAGDPSSADAPTPSSAPEIATVSPPGDAQSTTGPPGEVTPSDDDAAAVAVGQTVGVSSWTGTFGADQWQLARRYNACLFALPAEGCAVSQVLVGQRGGGLQTAHARERSPTEAKGSSARAQRPESPRRRAPERRVPVPTMPSSSVGSGTSEGSHGGAVLGLIGAVVGLLALAGTRPLAPFEGRPPRPPLISLLERPG